MKATEKIDEKVIENSGCGVSREKIMEAIQRDLGLPDTVEILQGIMPKTQPKSMTEIAYFECIDNAELDDYESAVAGSSDPNAARRAYANSPKPFYVKIISSGGGMSYHAQMLEGRELSDMRKSKETFYRVELMR